ncbi:MAG: DUF4164 family protein [Rhodospirillaceae bacterium]|nr:DUF4164 family protein [Rhodospirillaceae bacterium]MBT5664584.1 DUF4164 family protein [Rhodospirillaceae bacterium]MBT5810900.1 DUF4164 family protein [Rhodospirillaceae bacterium]
MSRLDDAQKRLETALTRLETAAADRAPTQNSPGSLEATVSENKALRDANDVVAQRLDDTIERLRRLVDE